MKAKKVLLVVDVQNDFCPKGALAVPEGDSIIPAINRYIRIFQKRGLPVLFTRDWHPLKTGHFKDFGGIWPRHCIQNTRGAAFCAGLRLSRKPILLYKGMEPDKDSYSAFHAEDQAGSSLFKILRRIGAEEIYIAGLATDYCVKFSTFDAIKKGFKVKVLTDAVKGVNLKPDDSKDALRKMKQAGAGFVTIKSIIRSLPAGRQGGKE